MLGNAIFGGLFSPESRPETQIPTSVPSPVILPITVPLSQEAVIDGTNLLYGSANDQQPSLLYVFGLLLELNRRHLAFKCFFDANTFFTLQSAGKKSEAYAYRRFCHDFPNHFIEVPGRNRADDFLLDYANNSHASVISNDQYRDFAHKYGWLTTGSRRRSSFLVHSGLMQIVALGINATIPHSLAEAESVLRQQFGTITGTFIPIMLPPPTHKPVHSKLNRSFAPAH